MSEPLADLFGRELDADEQILWAGRPVLGFVLRSSDAVFIPFSILWGGFAIFWETGVIVAGAPLLFKLWGVPFVVVGLYMMVGRFFVDMWQRGRTYYCVTSQRILIVRGRKTRSVISLDLAPLSEISLSEKRNGAGLISFGRRAQRVSWDNAGNRILDRSNNGGWPCFELESEARKVFDLIRAARWATKNAG
jgi:hypothetical protein